MIIVFHFNLSRQELYCIEYHKKIPLQERDLYLKLN
jgi:hypothetical protein